jgi:Tfp pilus assembly protein PilF
MSKTLNLVDGLLSRGRNLHRHGLLHDAAGVLRKLSAFRHLPADVAAETQSRLAEIMLEAAAYKQARRHLTAALAHQPEQAQYHYRMAVAVEEDPQAPSTRASRHYRRALALAPDNPVYLCDFGLHLLQIGKPGTGLKCLRQAVHFAQDDPDILGAAAEALRSQGQVAEAEKILRLALFRNSRDRRFRDLWDRHQFQVLQQGQQTAARPAHPREDSLLLPFFRPHKDNVPPMAERKIVRLDGPSGVPGPKLPVRRKLSR